MNKLLIKALKCIPKVGMSMTDFLMMYFFIFFKCFFSQKYRMLNKKQLKNKKNKVRIIQDFNQKEVLLQLIVNFKLNFIKLYFQEMKLIMELNNIKKGLKWLRRKINLFNKNNMTNKKMNNKIVHIIRQ